MRIKQCSNSQTIQKHKSPSTSDRVKTADKITALKKPYSYMSKAKRVIAGNTGIEEVVQIYIPTEKGNLLLLNLEWNIKQLILNKTSKSSKIK